MSQAFADIQEYQEERPNLTKLPVDKGYHSRYQIRDEEIEWDHPTTAHYEEVIERSFSSLKERIVRDYLANLYGTHPPEITPDLTDMFKEQGLRIDTYGRPCNPGGKTGLGNRWGLWQFGGRDTADGIVTRGESIKNFEFLGITKAGKDKIALPGGFVEPGEDNVEAAQREVREETHVRVGEAIGELLAVRLLLRSSRTTDHAWLHGNVTHFHLKGNAAKQIPEADDDADEANWFKVNYLNLATMSEHHRAPIVSVAKELGFLAAVYSRE